MNGEVLYRKVGKRYVPAGWDAVPHQEGVWLMRVDGMGEESLYVGKLCDIPDVPVAAGLMAKVHECAGVLDGELKANGERMSVWDIARCVLLAAAGVKR